MLNWQIKLNEVEKKADKEVGDQFRTQRLHMKSGALRDADAR
jgi:hypothetical protein